MHSPATNATTTSGGISPVSTPVTSQHGDAPSRLPAKQPTLTQDFYLDTFFNPVWTAGQNVFSFAKDGTVVRPQTYETEHYPGYHAERPRRLESANPSHFPRRDPKPWKNVAITEQDEAEWEAFKERMRKGELGEWRQPTYSQAKGIRDRCPSNLGLDITMPRAGRTSPMDGELVSTWKELKASLV